MRSQQSISGQLSAQLQALTVLKSKMVMLVSVKVLLNSKTFAAPMILKYTQDATKMMRMILTLRSF